MTLEKHSEKKRSALIACYKIQWMAKRHFRNRNKKKDTVRKMHIKCRLHKIQRNKVWHRIKRDGERYRTSPKTDNSMLMIRIH